jgi:hypothetical protein
MMVDDETYIAVQFSHCFEHWRLLQARLTCGVIGAVDCIRLLHSPLAPHDGSG